MQYETLFDLSAQPFHAGPVVVLSCALLVFAVWRLVHLRRHPAGGGVSSWLVGVLGLTLLLGVARLHERAELTRMLTSGSSEVVEGVIEKHWTNRPVWTDGEPGAIRAYETFSVGGVVFQYYRGKGDVAFNNTSAEPLVFATGMRVRIRYAPDAVERGPRNRILTLELAEDDVFAARSGAVRGRMEGRVIASAAGSPGREYRQ